MQVPYGCVINGLAMTTLLVLCHPHNVAVFLGAIMLLATLPSERRLFHCLCAVMFPLMEVVIIHLSGGQTWTYTHPDFFNVPLYIFPLWAVVGDCVAELAKFTART